MMPSNRLTTLPPLNFAVPFVKVGVLIGDDFVTEGCICPIDIPVSSTKLKDRNMNPLVSSV